MSQQEKPDISTFAYVSIQRLAWLFDMSFNETIEHMVRSFHMQVDQRDICRVCKDKKDCQKCAFSQRGTSPYTDDLFAVPYIN